MRRRVFVRLACWSALGLAGARPGGAGTGPAGGWQLRFRKVHDLLKVRVGGPTGPLIAWADRGKSGRHTWASKDPVGEVRGIAKWVGDAPRITLYGEIAKDAVEGTGDQQCELDVLYAGRPVDSWEFQDPEDKGFQREPGSPPEPISR